MKQLVQRRFFLNNIRPLTGRLNDEQTEGLISVIIEYDRWQVGDTRWLAYILATAWARNKAIQVQPELLVGMMKGIYTGKCLADYFDSSITDWVNARQIIATDRAEEIAGYAIIFHNAIRLMPEITISTN